MATKDTDGGQQRATRSTEEVEEVQQDAQAAEDLKERQEKLSDDVDSVLDEIDDVLEENAEDFVRSFVQKGGNEQAGPTLSEIRRVGAACGRQPAGPAPGALPEPRRRMCGGRPPASPACHGRDCSGPGGRVTGAVVRGTCGTARRAVRGCGGRPGRQYRGTGAGRDEPVPSHRAPGAICATAPAVQVDHSHETGRVRGVVCFNCNSAIGKLGHGPDTLRRAIAYVEGNAWKPTLVAPGGCRLPS